MDVAEDAAAPGAAGAGCQQPPGEPLQGPQPKASGQSTLRRPPTRRRAVRLKTEEAVESSSSSSSEDEQQTTTRPEEMWLEGIQPAPAGPPGSLDALVRGRVVKVRMHE